MPGHFARAAEPLANIVSGYLNSYEFAQRGLLKRAQPQDIIRVEYPGFSVFADQKDPGIGRNVVAKVYEPEIERAFRKFLRSGMVVVDIGANIGFFTMLARSLVGASGHVLAVEPNPENVRMIEASRRTNGFDNVEVLCAAASTGIGVVSLHVEHSNGFVASPSDLDQVWEGQLVPAVALDGIIGGRSIDFIKIDIEGNEPRALKGAVETLKRCRPIVISEFAHTGIVDGGGEPYLRFLLDLGYGLGVVPAKGEIVDCGSDAGKVIEAFHRNGTDHINIIAIPRSC